MARPRIHEKRRSSTSSLPSGVAAQSLTSKSSVRFSENTPPPGRSALAAMKAIRLPPVSRPCSEIAITAPPSGPSFGATSTHSMLWLDGSSFTPGGIATGWPRARSPSCPISKRTTCWTRSMPT